MPSAPNIFCFSFLYHYHSKYPCRGAAHIFPSSITIPCLICQLTFPLCIRQIADKYFMAKLKPLIIRQTDSPRCVRFFVSLKIFCTAQTAYVPEYHHTDIQLSTRTGCKILLAQKAFSNYDLYPVLSPYLAGTEASGLYEARLGAEECRERRFMFSVEPTGRKNLGNCCNTRTTSCSSPRVSWSGLAMPPKRQEKA